MNVFGSVYQKTRMGDILKQGNTFILRYLIYTLCRRLKNDLAPNHRIWNINPHLEHKKLLIAARLESLLVARYYSCPPKLLGQQVIFWWSVSVHFSLQLRIIVILHPSLSGRLIGNILSPCSVFTSYRLWSKID